ncbi:hypothetical protein [Cellulosimicrobium sp. SH8]|uniref:hypothetical protein n=1 Tax=Cellulosimicrobium sp. SH8 TaxID=2952936 RepID=UPI0021F2647B|nr:hypothetical protein [Cellulosimicrobium sp. SH8]
MGEHDEGRRLIRRKRDDRPGFGASAPRPDQLEDRSWSERRPLNYDNPPRSPVKPSGDLPVIVRLLWETHEELLPARAIRWTDTHVMVVIKPLEPPYNQHELIAWLRVEDVFRSIPRRSRGGGRSG